MAALPPLRRSAASWLRGLAARLEPNWQVAAGRPAAPLVRIGGTWWPRDAIFGPDPGDERPRPETASLAGGAPPGVYLALFAFVWLQRVAIAIAARARRR